MIRLLFFLLRSAYAWLNRLLWSFYGGRATDDDEEIRRVLAHYVFDARDRRRCWAERVRRE